VKPFPKPFAAISLSSLLLLFTLIACLGCNTAAEQNDSRHTTVKGDSLLLEAVKMMDAGSFEEAQSILITALNTVDSPYSTTDQYYFHSHLAEIMYYTALNEQGIQNARESMRIAVELQNDTLLGNAENLLGLIHLNSERYDSAQFYFKRALENIPQKHDNPKLSRYDQVLGNLSEIYLKLNDGDKAIEFARKAQNISNQLNNQRAIILNNWTLAEAWMIKENFDSCLYFLRIGLQNPQIHEEPDAHLFLLSTALKLDVSRKNKDAIIPVLDTGLVLCDRLKNHDFAKSDFLQNAVTSLIKVGDFKQAATYQNRLNTIQNRIQKAQENLHMRLLNAYYQKESELSKQLSEAGERKNEIKLNRIILVSLVSIILLMILFIVFFRRWMNQLRKTELLQFNQEKENIKQEQELNLMRDRFTTIEAERNRIARELHDDIGSSLSSISIFADLALSEFPKDSTKALGLIERVKHKNQEVSDTISDLIWAIYSKNDTMGSLVTRVRTFGFDVLTTRGIEVKIEDDFRLKDAVLSIELKKNLLLFFKEALNNIAKYSGASQAIIVIEYVDGTVHISISDNGKGFDPKLIRHGNGLAGFQARANAIGARFVLDSAIGTGTRLMLSFPFSITELPQSEAQV
jgi:signal transduction histidine kinase